MNGFTSMSVGGHGRRSLPESLTPPVVYRLGLRLRSWMRLSRPDWLYVSGERGGDVGEGVGWSDRVILEAQLQRWPSFISAISGAAPLAANYEQPGVPADA
jgi:hypothetical protein